MKPGWLHGVESNSMFDCAEYFYEKGDRESGCKMYLEGLNILLTRWMHIPCDQYLGLCVREQHILRTLVLPDAGA